MAYTPPRQTSQFDVGERVIGKFRFVKAEGEKAVKVLWHTEDKQLKSRVVLLEECPEGVQEDLQQVYKSEYDEEFSISLNTDMTSIVYFHPANGQFKVVVDRLPSSEDQPPTPDVKTGKWGDYMQFTVIVRIVEGKCQGITLPIILRYDKFAPEQTEDGMVTGYAHAQGASPHCDFLSDFCDATGVWEFDAIPWEQNILPELERRIMRLERKFNVMMRDGWVDVIYPIYDYDEEEESSDPVEEHLPWTKDEEGEETMEVNQEEEEMIDPDWD